MLTGQFDVGSSSVEVAPQDESKVTRTLVPHIVCLLRNSIYRFSKNIME
ncbi:rCG46918 [Rattus norvegicus]|uniref:RCG46918 n=1 Tax=Rattus norvegicus TaxID=10116 RepID=A6IXA4_RAT|nr:rCG46918 [Rattus norvegicus]